MCTERPRSILNPVEQRIYGIVHIAQGVTMVVLGDRAPKLVLPYIRGKARARGRTR